MAESCYAKFHNAEGCNAECRYAECGYSDCRYAECPYAECPGATTATATTTACSSTHLEGKNIYVCNFLYEMAVYGRIKVTKIAETPRKVEK
jgi:hypothetical protein